MGGVLSRLVVFTGVVAACAAAASLEVQAQDTITVRAARVVDGKGAVLQNSTVEIRDGTIVTVDQRQGTVTYDLGDATLMPGLIDVHVHTSSITSARTGGRRTRARRRPRLRWPARRTPT